MDETFERHSVDGRVVERLPRPPIAAEHGLLPHPEGGWYRRTWASDVEVRLDRTDAGGGGRVRPTATAVLFALPVGEASAWHVVASAELWCWHGPGTVTLQLGGSGAAPVPQGEVVLGLDAAAGQRPQVLVPAGTWQRTSTAEDDALVTCVVSPGFDFADFRLADPRG